MNVRVDAKTVPQTTVNLAGLASAVVVATFDSFGPGRWDTPNGEMPPDPESLGTPVYRDANFTSAAALRGTAQPALTLRVAGGDTGCSHYEFSAAPQLLPGTRYVVWVIDAYDATRSGNQTPWAIAAWAVGPGDVVATPLEGALGLQAIVAIEKANPKGSHGQCQGGACP